MYPSKTMTAATGARSVMALCALALSLTLPSCALDDSPELDEAYAPSNVTRQLIRKMANRGKLFVFDKDKTLVGGDTDKVRELLGLIRQYNGNMAVLTSNTTMENGEYKAIKQLQRKFGKQIFPDSFFETPAFQVNDKVGDRTKANEMGDIIDYFLVRDSEVAFYDDKASNISDVRAKYPGVVGIRVNPDRSMTEADLRRGMERVLGSSDDSSDPSDSGKSNLQVKLGGTWRGVCCRRGDLVISDAACRWEEHGRRLETRDIRSGRATELDCPENGQRPADCTCSSRGERMHGISDGDDRHVENSLAIPNGAPIFPNSGHETCIDLTKGELRSRWTSNSCPDWRLRDFY